MNQHLIILFSVFIQSSKPYLSLKLLSLGDWQRCVKWFVLLFGFQCVVCFSHSARQRVKKHIFLITAHEKTHSDEYISVNEVALAIQICVGVCVLTGFLLCWTATRSWQSSHFSANFPNLLLLHPQNASCCSHTLANTSTSPATHGYTKKISRERKIAGTGERRFNTEKPVYL